MQQWPSVNFFIGNNPAHKTYCTKNHEDSLNAGQVMQYTRIHPYCISNIEWKNTFQHQINLQRFSSSSQYHYKNTGFIQHPLFSQRFTKLGETAQLQYNIKQGLVGSCLTVPMMSFICFLSILHSERNIFLIQTGKSIACFIFSTCMEQCSRGYSAPLSQCNLLLHWEQPVL